MKIIPGSQAPFRHVPGANTEAIASALQDSYTGR
jgi:hypothetical protein